MIGPTIDRSALGKPPRLLHNRQQSTVRGMPDNSAVARPDDLGVTPWYLDELGIAESSSSSGICERGPYAGSSGLRAYPRHSERSLPIVGRHELYSNKERESSVESADVPRGGSTAPRKAYMDLTDAIALLDETCPNQEYSASPSLTPRTPRTPLTPFPRSRRARSKSSDNSSNYSSEVTCDRSSLETSKSQDKHDRIIKQRRPFLRKIGISMTEDRPFLAKIIAPKFTGKPYLEKIGPSRAVDKPFLEKIGSSKTLDRFTFDALRELPRVMVRRRQPAEPSPLTIERNPTEENEDDDLVEDVIVVVKDIGREPEEDEEAAEEEEEDDDEEVARTIEGTKTLSRIGSRRTNGKGYLLKMYSFETEDLNESSNAANKAHRDPLRGASLDDVLDSGPSSFPPSEDSHEHASSRSDERSFNGAELVKCRVTTSEEIFSTAIEGTSSSPRETASWRNSPRWPKRRSRRVASAPRSRATEREDNPRRVFPSDESTPNSPTKRRISPERTDDSNDRLVVSRTKNSSLPRYLGGSPSKARRQAGSEEPPEIDEGRSRRASEEILRKEESTDRESTEKEAFARCKSRRQTFKEAVEKFGGSETKARRQASEEMLDKNRKIDESERFDDPYNRFRERRGISSDNLKLSRETVVASVPSTSSLGYQSGDSSLVSQRSSHHSQDFVRGTLKILHDKFELQEVPSESYAAFKRRTRANHNRVHNRTAESDYSRNEETPSIVSAMRNRNNKNNTSSTSPAAGNYYNNNNVNNNNNNNTTGSVSGARDSKEVAARSTSEDTTTSSKSSITTKSVLRKQDGVDHQSDQEMETSGSTLRCPKRRIIHEPSQETMDLLTELRRVKSLLKRTPSIEVEEIGQDFSKPLSRFPKKILLTDKEFCLSVERENSVRRRPSMLPEPNSSETEKPEETLIAASEKSEGRVTERVESSGPALFEKRCLSLDYADEEKPPKPDVRAISLASARLPARSGTEETIDSSDLAGLAYDARSYCSDVFTASPSDETEETRNRIETRSSEESPEIPNVDDRSCVDLDIAIPVDHVGSISPKRRIHIQGRTSDLYEIISPRSTPFRVKRRLGRISVEETVKQESFTLSKLDCRTLATQKKTKCFPL